jgi:DNA-binding LacI/PurR family transcriptional regulator
VVVNDLMALGVMKRLYEMGLKLPEDMAVVGCDNQFFSAYLLPPLTTLEVDTGDHGRVAMQQLLQARDTDTAPFTQVRVPMLVIRQSCGAELGPRVFQ